MPFRTTKKQQYKVSLVMDRRTFFKLMGAGIAGTAGCKLITPELVRAEGINFVSDEFYGILVDTTRCIGCRRCEKACAEVNNLPIPDINEALVFNQERQTSIIQYNVVNRFETEKGAVFVPRRCMHCNQAACVAACLVKAMKKRKTGQVTWDENCLGCRLCMVSCPFDIPKFEYDKAIPKIQKCTLCWERFQDGKRPGCVEACPTDALLFGTRRQLLEEARRRIYQHPGNYYPHIFGELEAGGTSHLYLSSVPFEQIGFRNDLGTTPYPEYSKGFLYAVPFILVLWPILMLGMSRVTKQQENKDQIG